MAKGIAKTSVPADVVTIERDGIAVEVDTAFIHSWEGIVLAADMQSDRLDDSQRLVATVDYYRHVCPNIADVDEAMSAEDGKPVDAGKLMQFVADCVKEATPKN